MEIKELHKIFLNHSSVCTDTRKASKNDLFFALKGDNFNGNLFAKEALEKGASYAVVDEQEVCINEKYILVEDVLKTLQDLAKFHRNYLGLKIIALTGSNGKTTTKELINNVLNTNFKTIATKGNLNNHIGVPLTLLKMTKNTEVGIVEMGANHANEIAFLCELTQPNYGYITNFGKAHLEGFGNLEGVIKAKSELYDYLNSNEGYIFINAADPIQLNISRSLNNVILFNAEDEDGIIIKSEETNPFVKVNYNTTSIASQLIGAYNFNNISAAIAIGAYFGIDNENIKNGIENYIPDNNRSQILEKGSNTIILDAYNANPTSMIAALENFSKIKGDSKIAILGDMFELGKEANKEHYDIAKFAFELEFNAVYLVGQNFYKTSNPEFDNKYFKSFDDLKILLTSSVFKNQTILIKGSRGMALERVLEFL